MPTYNRSNVLPYSIGSVLKQTHENWQLLVVGDGCVDDSEEVVQGIADPRIRWIGLDKNSGHQSAPNNRGLEIAAGELVAYLGHDDIWLPHHLGATVDAIKNGADFAYGLTLMASESGEDNYIGPTRIPYMPGRWIPPSSVVHAKSLTDQLGGWRDYRNLDMAPDTELWQRFFLAGKRFELVPRLVAVKISAARRKNAYGLRSSHEQAYWTDRMSDADFEPTELARCYISATRINGRLGDMAINAGRIVRNRLWKRRIDIDRAYKGLEE